MSTIKKYRARLISQLGIEWHEENLFTQALTHSSSMSEKSRTGFADNERLEFLGDAVLELAVSDYLYRNNPGMGEGELTKFRAAVVCEASLARAAREIDLGPCLSMGKGEERSGGRERPSILADAFEALLGSVYLDQGLSRAADMIIRFLKPVIDDVSEGRLERDHKTILQEMLQQRGTDSASYVTIGEEGPDHDKTFTAGVVYRGQVVGTGLGRTKKDSEQQAAKMALEWLDKMQ